MKSAKSKWDKYSDQQILDMLEVIHDLQFAIKVQKKTTYKGRPLPENLVVSIPAIPARFRRGN